MAKAPLCPCHSGRRYSECCKPFHAGKEPPDAEALMRSRYAAFALGDAAYLWRTTHPEHPLKQKPEAQALAELKQSARAFKYAGLTILDRALAPPGEQAEVLFLARLFQAGKDYSFVERSRFRHDGAGWRYLGGSMKVAAELDRPDALTLATFPAGPPATR